MTQKLFSELGLSPELLKAIERMGFEQASPIQAEAIPRLLEGHDVIGQSHLVGNQTPLRTNVANLTTKNV